MDNVNIIRPGFIAPVFELFDSEGEKVSLAFLIGEKTVFLVFFPGLKKKENQDFLRLFQDRFKEIKLKGGIVLGITAVGKRELKEKKTKLNIEFPVLSDENSTVISQYGVKNTSSERSLCYPAIFVIDKNGLIRYRKVWVEEDLFPELEKIVLNLDELI